MSEARNIVDLLSQKCVVSPQTISSPFINNKAALELFNPLGRLPMPFWSLMSNVGLYKKYYEKVICLFVFLTHLLVLQFLHQISCFHVIYVVLFLQ